MWIGRDEEGVCAYSDKPVWDKETKTFWVDTSELFMVLIDKKWGESLEIGQCAEIVGVTLGEVETFGEVKEIKKINK